MIGGANFNQPVWCALEGAVFSGEAIALYDDNVWYWREGRNDAAEFLDGFVGVGLVVDGVDEVALEARVKQGWHGFLLGTTVEELPGGRGFDVGLAEEGR